MQSRAMQDLNEMRQHLCDGQFSKAGNWAPVESVRLCKKNLVHRSEGKAKCHWRILIHKPKDWRRYTGFCIFSWSYDVINFLGQTNGDEKAPTRSASNSNSDSLFLPCEVNVLHKAVKPGPFCALSYRPLPFSSSLFPLPERPRQW